MSAAGRVMLVTGASRRIGESDEVAAAVCWLCSDEASYMTGAIVNVSGGRELFVRS